MEEYRTVEEQSLQDPEKTIELLNATRTARPGLLTRLDLSTIWRRFLLFLIPTFLKSHVQPHVGTESLKALHPTAYLDGIRGIAALLVLVYHATYNTYPIMVAYDGKGPHTIFQWPFARSLLNGNAMVSIFFVVSGYALSYKPVRLIRAGRTEELTVVLSSSAFRRGLRLFLPGIASSFFIVLLVRLGLYEMNTFIANDPAGGLTQHREVHQVRYDSLHEQLTAWSYMIWRWLHPWNFETTMFNSRIRIDGHLWTIPVEFRSSMVLYLTQLGVSRLKDNVRLSILVALMVWVSFKDRWEMLLFYGGFLLAELDLKRKATSSIKLPVSTWKSSIHSSIPTFAFILGLFLCGQPAEHMKPANEWGVISNYYIPRFIDEKPRYWCGWGALMIVWATSCSLFLQRLFTNKPVQYLGRISFSLYLMHGPVIHTLGYGIMDVMWRNVGHVGMTKDFGWWVAFVAILTVSVWFADMFMRVVDIPSVRFAKWLEERCVREGL